MHSARVTLPHFIPVVAGEFEFGRRREFDLGQCDEVVEARFARHLLLQEPAHRRKRRRLGKPGKERVVLPGSVLLQCFEPGDEGLGVVRRRGRALDHSAAFLFDEFPFEHGQFELCRQPVAPTRLGKGGCETPAVPSSQPSLQNQGPRAFCALRQVFAENICFRKHPRGQCNARASFALGPGRKRRGSDELFQHPPARKNAFGHSCLA